MTNPSLSFALGLNVLAVLKPKGFEDADGHCLPLEKRTDTDADGSHYLALIPACGARHDE
jgi:hypothetical protein